MTEGERLAASTARQPRLLAGPLLGDDGHWRRLVEVDGQVSVQWCDPPLDGSSATWARGDVERSALADLMRGR